MAKPIEPALSPKEVAAIYGVALRTVHVWLKLGKLPGHKIGHNWHIWRSDLPGKKEA